MENMIKIFESEEFGQIRFQHLEIVTGRLVK